MYIRKCNKRLRRLLWLIPWELLFGNTGFLKPLPVLQYAKKDKKNLKKAFQKQKILHIRYVRDKARGAGAVTAVLRQRMLAYRWKYGCCRNADT
jgi:hypothetical protein